MNRQEPIQPNMELFSALSDEMRLKIMMILSESEFTVNEIKDILGIHQSNASRHLAKLSACRLLKDRRESTKSYYGLSDELYGSPSLREIIKNAYEQLPDLQILKSQIEQVLSERRTTMARKLHKLDESAGGLKAQISLFTKLITPFEHAIDIGCGAGGDLSVLLAGRCKHVTAIDIQPEVVSEFNDTLEKKGIQNVTAITADMVSIPLPDACADLVLMSQVLHYATSPDTALKEAIRLLKPNGTLALLDLAPHTEEELRERQGHLWLGFDQARIEMMLKDLPCKIVSSEAIANSSAESLPAICFIVEKQ